MLDRLQSMAVFVKVADLGSFTAAARALDMSSQMVGKHVGALEARLGAELIRRTTRRQSLTAIGHAFQDRCRTVLAEAEAAETLAQDLAATPRGRLRINAPVTFGACCLAPLLGPFLEDFVDVGVELVLSDRYVDLVDEGYDAVVRLGPLADSTLVARALQPHRLVACAAPSYLARRGAPNSPDDLNRHDCLGFVYSTGVPHTEWAFHRGGTATTVTIASRYQSNDARVLHAAALAGHGIVMQAERILAADIAAGRLRRVLTEYTAPSRPMHILFSASRRRSASLQLFVDRVVAEFG